jgi:hypothetical protein
MAGTNTTGTHHYCFICTASIITYASVAEEHTKAQRALHAKGAAPCAVDGSGYCCPISMALDDKHLQCKAMN